MTLRPWSTITGGARNLYDHWRRVDPDAAAATQLAARRVFRDEPRVISRKTVHHEPFPAPTEVTTVEYGDRQLLRVYRESEQAAAQFGPRTKVLGIDFKRGELTLEIEP